jgi:hypothetical protein
MRLGDLMIRFKCNCSQLFECSDDQAGTSFQCPACGRLVDVPTLSELPAISEDGTYKMDADPEVRPPDEQLARVEELERVYTRHRTDEFGREIDLRTTLDDVKLAGTDEIPLSLADEAKPGAPKYDPITGELIRPLDVKDDRNASLKGVWQGAPIDYSKVDKLPFQPWQIIPELFRLPNLAVMFAVVLMHAVILLMLFPLSLKFLILGPFLLAIIGGFFAHYTNIVEDVGPSGCDELPRPLRDLQWGEDLWGPFSRFMLAILIAYGLSFTAFYLPAPARPHFLLVIEIIGAFIFPALLLTTATSGSVTNLRPDRVLRVIKAIGVPYFFLALGWFVGSIAYMTAFLATALTFLHMFDRDGMFPYDWYLSPLITYPALLGVIYFMHALMWYLGLQYRYHHHEFPWVLQVHHRDPSLPPRRGFEVQRERRRPKPISATPLAAQPVLPVEDPMVGEETPAQTAARRQRLMQQHAQRVQHGSAPHPVRPIEPVNPPPDDNFDIDELLKP